MWFTMLAACWWFPPTETSTSGMAGVVHRADGTPFAGLLVETVESTERTDADGRFGLYYKRPDTHVHFIDEGIWYRRRYVEADAGTVVDVRLPETAPLTVDCGMFACDVELRWELSPGFTGKGRTRCEPDATPVVRGAPAVAPAKITCRDGAAPPVDIVPDVSPGRVVLTSGPRTVSITVARDGADDILCQVGVAGEQSPSTGDPVEVTVSGAGQAVAVCAERPAWPAPFDHRATNVEVAWTGDGPSLRLPPGMEHQHLVLSAGTRILHGRATRDGAFLLPPLPPATYQVELHDGTRPTTTPALEPVPKDGVVVGRRLAAGGFVGVLELTEELSAGTIEVLPVGD
jgi:hypothetical protein